MKQPGDKLASTMEYMPGKGVYEENGELFAGVCGEVSEDNENMKISILRSVSIPVEIKEGDTFQWGGKYSDDYNSRETLFTKLGVFDNYTPIVNETLYKRYYSNS